MTDLNLTEKEAEVLQEYVARHGPVPDDRLDEVVEKLRAAMREAARRYGERFHNYASDHCPNGYGNRESHKRLDRAHVSVDGEASCVEGPWLRDQDMSAWEEYKP